MSPQSELPLVSCIIAVFNGEAYLREAIDSLLEQTYAELEIVVVNDGSTDGTANVIDGYGDRVRVLNQANCGVSIARNRGVAMSTGQLLCFLDADDRVDRRKIAMQVATFEADAQLEFCDCHASYFWSAEISAEGASAIFAMRGHSARGVAVSHRDMDVSPRTLEPRRRVFSFVTLF